MDFPIKNGGSFNSYVTNYQRALFTTLATQSQPQPSSAIPQSHSRARLAILCVSCVLSESALLEVDSLVLSVQQDRTRPLFSHTLIQVLCHCPPVAKKQKTYNVRLFIPTEVVPQQTFPRYPRYRWGFPLKAACWIMDSRGSAELVSSLPFVRFAAWYSVVTLRCCRDPYGNLWNSARWILKSTENSVFLIRSHSVLCMLHYSK